MKNIIGLDIIKNIDQSFGSATGTIRRHENDTIKNRSILAYSNIIITFATS